MAEDLQYYYTGDGYEYRLGDRMWFLPDYSTHQSALYYAISGLSQPETDKTWSEGEYTEFTLDIADTLQSLKLHFDLADVYIDNDVNNRQIVSCYVNGKYCGKKALYVASRKLEFNLPQELLDNRIIMKLIYSNAAKPLYDDRLFAIAYKYFDLTVTDKCETNTDNLIAELDTLRACLISLISRLFGQFSVLLC